MGYKIADLRNFSIPDFEYVLFGKPLGYEMMGDQSATVFVAAPNDALTAGCTWLRLPSLAAATATMPRSRSITTSAYHNVFDPLCQSFLPSTTQPLA
jgi:hypothetical protein